MNKSDLLTLPVEHIDITAHKWRELVDAMGKTAFQARNIGNAARIYDRMLSDPDCAIILCLAGSLFSAGLKKVVVDMIRCNMVDAIVSTGAIMVDQDFFEALGFRHYQGSQLLDDNMLRGLSIDRIYDTLIDEDMLRVCDNTIYEIAEGLSPRPYSSREFIAEMGRWLESNKQCEDSVVREAWAREVPVFVPAFSDCSAGFGLILHQDRRREKHVSIDSAKDFLELTRLKVESKETGLLMVGGGVPKNFAQDTVVAAELLGREAPMHKYAVQITVADERDGGLSGSTLREASSWGKVSTEYEQIVYCEATVAFPMIAGYGWEKGAWKQRQPRKLAGLFASESGGGE